MKEPIPPRAARLTGEASKCSAKALLTEGASSETGGGRRADQQGRTQTRRRPPFLALPSTLPAISKRSFSPVHASLHVEYVIPVTKANSLFVLITVPADACRHAAPAPACRQAVARCPQLPRHSGPKFTPRTCYVGSQRHRACGPRRWGDRGPGPACRKRASYQDRKDAPAASLPPARTKCSDRQRLWIPPCQTPRVRSRPCHMRRARHASAL